MVPVILPEYYYKVIRYSVTAEMALVFPQNSLVVSMESTKKKETFMHCCQKRWCTIRASVHSQTTRPQSSQTGRLKNPDCKTDILCQLPSTDGICVSSEPVFLLMLNRQPLQSLVTKHTCNHTLTIKVNGTNKM